MIKRLPLLIVALLCSNSVLAEVDNRFISGKVSSMGAGLEYSHGVGEKFNIRVGAYGASTSKDFEESGIDYSGDVKLRNYKLVTDYYPWKNGFRVTGGTFYADNEISVSADATDLEVGNDTYDAGIKGSISQDGFAPYIGIGWDKASQKKRGWSFSADAGVALELGTNVSLDVARCPASTLACNQFKADLVREENSLRNDVSDLDMLPVISIGASRSF